MQHFVARNIQYTTQVQRDPDNCSANLLTDTTD